MSSSTAHTFPIPRIPSTNTTKTAKKRGKTLVERTATKREAERARNKTRVNIGVAYERWRELRDRRNLKSDAEMATFLIDRADDFFDAQDVEDTNPATTFQSMDTRYCKLCNKKSKTWSLYTVKVEKDYGYMADLQSAILDARLTSDKGPVANPIPQRSRARNAVRDHRRDWRSHTN
ncbi:unnamed protein product [Arctogadus glacialis]